MKELTVHLGYPRIHFERAFAEDTSLSLDLTTETCGNKFSGLLGQKRREYQTREDASRYMQPPFGGRHLSTAATQNYTRHDIPGQILQ